MPGGKRNPCVGGPYDATEVARRVKRWWLGLPAEHRPGGKQLAQAMGLASESAWTKRIDPERPDWVPFRVDELSMIKRELAPDEPPGWPLLDDSALSMFRQAWKRAHGAAPPEDPASAAPSGQPERHTVKGRRKAY